MSRINIGLVGERVKTLSQNKASLQKEVFEA
jgi:hypothetical protein